MKIREALTLPEHTPVWAFDRAGRLVDEGVVLSRRIDPPVVRVRVLGAAGVTEYPHTALDEAHDDLPLLVRPADPA